MQNRKTPGPVGISVVEFYKKKKIWYITGYNFAI